MNYNIYYIYTIIYIMSDKFEQQIQQWVNIDNQLKILNEKVYELREKKHNLCENLTNHIQTNNMINKYK